MKKGEDTLKLKGRGKLTAYYKGTKKVFKVIEFKNVICTVGKQLMGDMLIDRSNYDTGLTYCAIGTGTTTPIAGDTQLENEGGGEAMRNTITSKSRSGNEITLSTFFTAAQSPINVKEAGIFGHSTAGVDENSGILFAHWLTSFDNSGEDYDLTFDYVLTIG